MSTASILKKTPLWKEGSSPLWSTSLRVEDTISILRGLKERYEVFHGVKIHDSALIAAAVLSNRYITTDSCPIKPSTLSMKHVPS